MLHNSINTPLATETSATHLDRLRVVIKKHLPKEMEEIDKLVKR